MPEIEQNYIGKSIDEIVKYYKESPLKWSRGLSLKRSISDFLQDNYRKKIDKFIDPNGNVDALLLQDISQYLNKSFYTFLCYKNLQLGGYYSWSLVTKYYCRFYLNLILNRIQGHAILRGSELGPGPKWLELLRSDWATHEYTSRKAKTGGSFHAYTWDVTKEYYKNIQLNNKFKLRNEDVKRFFNDDFLKKFIVSSDFKMPREDLEDRDNFTYDSLGFDEFSFGSDGANISPKEGKKDFIDDSVYIKEMRLQSEHYDGTGTEEHELGLIIRFTMELLGQISEGIIGKFNPICFRRSFFENLKTNDDTLETLTEWAKSNKLHIT